MEPLINLPTRRSEIKRDKTRLGVRREGQEEEEKEEAGRCLAVCLGHSITERDTWRVFRESEG